MKKFILVAMTFAMLFGACACSRETEQEKPTTDDRVYNNVADFSSQQGWNGWYYMYRDSMGEIYKMTFDLDSGRSAEIFTAITPSENSTPETIRKRSSPGRRA